MGGAFPPLSSRSGSFKISTMETSSPLFLSIGLVEKIDSIRIANTTRASPLGLRRAEPPSSPRRGGGSVFVFRAPHRHAHAALHAFTNARSRASRIVHMYV